MSEVLVRVKRGDVAECLHRGHIAVVDTAGELLASVGDPDYNTFTRSAAKPVQALAVVESGAYEVFRLTERELAVICASHSAEAYHVEAVLGLLAKLGLDASHLRCGADLPQHVPSAHELIRQGRPPAAVHGDCSGKHAGMLAVAKRMGWSLDDYFVADHPVQRLCRRNVAEVSGYPEERMVVAKDGCGAAVFALPMRNMALAFARLSNPDDPRTGFSRERAAAAALIVRSMRAHPEMVAGTGRLCTALMRATPIVAKGGAEGVYGFGVPGMGLGCALKVEDGSPRAVGPAVVRILDGLRLLTAEAASALEEFGRPVGTNLRGEVIGVTEATFEIGLRRGRAPDQGLAERAC